MKLDQLYVLGLSEKEAQVFNFFIKNLGKSLEKKQITEKSSIDSNYLGQILTKLIQKKLIQAFGRKPKKYIFELNLLKSFHRELTELKTFLMNQLNSSNDEAILDLLKLSRYHKMVLNNLLQLNERDKITLNDIEKNGIFEELKKIEIEEKDSSMDLKLKIRRILEDLLARNFIQKQKIQNRNYFSVLDISEIKEVEYNRLEKRYSYQEKLIGEIIQEIEKSSRKKKPTHQSKPLVSVVSGLKKYYEKVNELVTESKAIFIKLKQMPRHFESHSNLVKGALMSLISKVIKTRENEDLDVRISLDINYPYEFFTRLDAKNQSVLHEIINKVKADRFEVRIPTKSSHHSFFSVFDSEIVLLPLRIGSDKSLIIEETEIAQMYQQTFIEEWDTGIDFRELIDEIPVEGVTRDLAYESLINHPPAAIVKEKLPPYLKVQGRQQCKSLYIEILSKVKRRVDHFGNILFDRFSTKEDYYAFDKISRDHGDLQVRWLLVEEYGDPNWMEVVQPFPKNDYLQYILNNIRSKKFQVRSFEGQEDNRFCIIDDSMLIVFQQESDKLEKMIVTSEREIVRNYREFFKTAWEQSIDARGAWMRKLSRSYARRIRKSFKSTPLQITLPAYGQIRAYKVNDPFDLYHLLAEEVSFKIYAMQIIPELEQRMWFESSTPAQKFYYLNRLNEEVEKNINLLATKERKFEIKFIHSISHELLEIWDKLTTDQKQKYFEKLFNVYPRLEQRFLPPTRLAQTHFSIYDEYFITQYGGFESNIPCRMVVVRDDGIRNAYEELFLRGWEETIDSRALFAAYSTNDKELSNFIYSHIKEAPIKGIYTVDDCKIFLETGIFPIKKTENGASSSVR